MIYFVVGAYVMVIVRKAELFGEVCWRCESVIDQVLNGRGVGERGVKLLVGIKCYDDHLYFRGNGQNVL